MPNPQLRHNRRIFLGTQPTQPAFKTPDELSWLLVSRELEGRGLPVPPRMPDYPEPLSLREFKVSDTPQSFLARLLANPQLTPERQKELLNEFDQGKGYGHSKRSW